MRDYADGLSGGGSDGYDDAGHVVQSRIGRVIQTVIHTVNEIIIPSKINVWYILERRRISDGTGRKLEGSVRRLLTNRPRESVAVDISRRHRAAQLAARRGRINLRTHWINISR